MEAFATYAHVHTPYVNVMDARFLLHHCPQHIAVYQANKQTGQRIMLDFLDRRSMQQWSRRRSGIGSTDSAGRPSRRQQTNCVFEKGGGVPKESSTRLGYAGVKRIATHLPIVHTSFFEWGKPFICSCARKDTRLLVLRERNCAKPPTNYQVRSDKFCLFESLMCVCRKHQRVKLLVKWFYLLRVSLNEDNPAAACIAVRTRIHQSKSEHKMDVTGHGHIHRLRKHLSALILPIDYGK